jgi:hypothetical protein
MNNIEMMNKFNEGDYICFTRINGSNGDWKEIRDPNFYTTIYEFKLEEKQVTPISPTVSNDNRTEYQFPTECPICDCEIEQEDLEYDDREFDKYTESFECPHCMEYFDLEPEAIVTNTTTESVDNEMTNVNSECGIPTVTVTDPSNTSISFEVKGFMKPNFRGEILKTITDEINGTVHIGYCYSDKGTVYSALWSDITGECLNLCGEEFKLTKSVTVEIGQEWQHKDGGIYVVERIDTTTPENVVWYKSNDGRVYCRTESHFLESFTLV